MSIPRSTALSCLLAFLSSPGLVCAQEQGSGNVGGNGLEPRLTLESAGSGALLVIRVRDVAPVPGFPLRLNLLVSTRPGFFPLDGLGIPGAAIGIDPVGMFQIGPLPTTSTGSLDLGIPIASEWAGAPLHVQAYYIDRSLPAPFLVFTDSASVVLGSPTPPLVVGVNGTQPGTIDLRRFHGDGSPGIPLPNLRALSVHELTLSALREERRSRRDLPSPIVIEGKSALRLPDGSTLVLTQHAGANETHLLHARAHGEVHVIHVAPGGTPAQIGIDPVMALSTHDALAAYSPEGVTQEIWLYRTDGSNHAGTAAPQRNVTPTGVTDPEAESFTFGANVLFVMDKIAGPFLIPLDGGSPVGVTLPASGGSPPVAFDSEIAVSGDGRSFAFGAGSDRRTKDIYVVREDGSAVNVTASPADYGEVGYSNPGRRLEMRLDHDGGRVAYVNHSTPEPEAFLRSLTVPSPVHLTDSTTFVDSIDVGSVGDLPAFGGVLMVAGIDEQSLDVYYSPNDTTTSLTNITQTGTAPGTPPFGLGSQLSILDLGTLTSAPQYLAHTLRSDTQTSQLLTIDAALGTSRIVAEPFAGVSLGLSQSPRIVAASRDRVIIADPADPTPAFRTELSLNAADVVHFISLDPVTDDVTVLAGSSAASLHLWRADTNALTLTQRTNVAGDYADIRAGFAPREVLLVGRGAKLLSFTDANGITDLGPRNVRFFLQRP